MTKHFFLGFLLAIVAGIFVEVRAALPDQPEVSWVPPIEWTDNTPLNPDTDISEYRLYCTGKPVITIPNSPGLTAWTAPVGEFPRGTYTCSMTAVSSDGIESAHSPEKGFEVAFPPKSITFTVQ